MEQVVHRSAISVSASPRLRPELPRLAAGRAVVIGHYSSTRCGLVVGDITAGFESAPMTGRHLRIAELEGVPVHAEAVLVPLLEQTAMVLDLKRLPFLGGLDVCLDPPERWLEFLEGSGGARPRADSTPW